MVSVLILVAFILAICPLPNVFPALTFAAIG
jgi:hypothetical protein